MFLCVPVCACVCLCVPVCACVCLCVLVYACVYCYGISCVFEWFFGVFDGLCALSVYVFTVLFYFLLYRAVPHSTVALYYTLL